MFKQQFRWLTGLIFGLFFSVPLFAADYQIFGPQNYLRASGSPVTATSNFNLNGVLGPYTLKLYNGGLEDDTAELVSSTEIYLNGVKIVAQNELNQNTAYLEKPVNLQSTNTIAVEVRGKPGGLLTLLIVGQQPTTNLSVAVAPTNWAIGTITPGAILTMSENQKITVLNNGNVNTNYSLRLVNPVGWQASQTEVAPSRYILNAAFDNDGNIAWQTVNHALSVQDTSASSVKFAGDQTGVNVAPNQTRNLWLQFKAPTSTQTENEQLIEVIITAQLP